MPTDVSTAEFPTAVLQRSQSVPVVVDFWASWCGPCRVIGPLLERLEAESSGAWELVKIDVDQNQALSQQFGVQGIPTVIGFRDGQPFARFTGALAEQQVRAWLTDIVPSPSDELVDQATAAASSEQAEALFRQALVHDPAHAGAGIGLAQMLLDRGETTAASELLRRLAPTPEVERMLAVASLASSVGAVDDLDAALDHHPDDHDIRLALGRALAAEGRHAEALEHLQTVVAGGDTASSEAARATILTIFQVLGDHPLVAEHRRRLANALF